MTTIDKDIGDAALQDLLDEADNLLHDLTTNETNDDGGEDLVIDGFAIDSDGEDDNVPKGNSNNNKSVDDHPLSDEWLSTPGPSTQATAAGTASEASLAVGTGGGTVAVNGGVGPNSSPLAAAATMDNFKQQTSRFASNLASMAQRAASQVAAAAVVQPGSMISTQPLPQQSSVPITQQYSYHQGQQQLYVQQPANRLTQVGPQQPNNPSAAELDKDQISQLLKQNVGDLLPGEKVIMFLSNLLHVGDTSGVSYAAAQTSDEYMWCCAMSYYRIILFSTANSEHLRQIQLTCPDEFDPICWPEGPETTKLLEMPLASIDRVEKTVYQASGSSYMGLILYAKDGGRSVRFTTPSYADTGRAFESLQTYAFPGRRNLGYLFAFESKRLKVMSSLKVDDATGQQTITISPTPKRFDPTIEYPRLMAKTASTQCPWLLWSINSTYSISPTYPSILVGPATLDPNKQENYNIVRQCAAFRSEQRLPSLTWCSVGGASIWRCSQPKVGLQGNRSPADELFLRHIIESARSANAIADPPPIYSRVSLQRLTGDFGKDWTPEPGCGFENSGLTSSIFRDGKPNRRYVLEPTTTFNHSLPADCGISSRFISLKVTAMRILPITATLLFSFAISETFMLSVTVTRSFVGCAQVWQLRI